jgi:hypothetical protein
MGELNLHCFKAESGTGELMRGSFCEGNLRSKAGDGGRKTRFN